MRNRSAIGAGPHGADEIIHQVAGIGLPFTEADQNDIRPGPVRGQRTILGEQRLEYLIVFGKCYFGRQTELRQPEAQRFGQRLSGKVGGDSNAPEQGFDASPEVESAFRLPR
ncbi:hypothetical protein [Virgisporangium aurantiacum]|uniref:hypothetical protein n=1 Tax=Virgisporangium aurantiacum TaxID=175570 RepID=UPI00194ED678|nr:hypothetical protein [Virgisporangium aurantiacum]